MFSRTILNSKRVYGPANNATVHSACTVTAAATSRTSSPSCAPSSSSSLDSSTFRCTRTCTVQAPARDSSIERIRIIGKHSKEESTTTTTRDSSLLCSSSQLLSSSSSSTLSMGRGRQPPVSAPTATALFIQARSFFLGGIPPPPPPGSKAPAESAGHVTGGPPNRGGGACGSNAANTQGGASSPRRAQGFQQSSTTSVSSFASSSVSSKSANTTTSSRQPQSSSVRSPSAAGTSTSARKSDVATTAIDASSSSSSSSPPVDLDVDIVIDGELLGEDELLATTGKEVTGDGTGEGVFGSLEDYESLLEDAVLKDVSVEELVMAGQKTEGGSNSIASSSNEDTNDASLAEALRDLSGGLTSSLPLPPNRGPTFAQLQATALELLPENGQVVPLTAIAPGLDTEHLTEKYGSVLEFLNMCGSRIAVTREKASGRYMVSRKLNVAGANIHATTSQQVQQGSSLGNFSRGGGIEGHTREQEGTRNSEAKTRQKVKRVSLKRVGLDAMHSNGGISHDTSGAVDLASTVDRLLTAFIQHAFLDDAVVIAADSSTPTEGSRSVGSGTLTPVSEPATSCAAPADADEEATNRTAPSHHAATPQESPPSFSTAATTTTHLPRPTPLPKVMTILRASQYLDDETRAEVKRLFGTFTRFLREAKASETLVDISWDGLRIGYPKGLAMKASDLVTPPEVLQRQFLQQQALAKKGKEGESGGAEDDEYGYAADEWCVELDIDEVTSPSGGAASVAAAEAEDKAFFDAAELEIGYASEIGFDTLQVATSEKKLGLAANAAAEALKAGKGLITSRDLANIPAAPAPPQINMAATALKNLAGDLLEKQSGNLTTAQAKKLLFAHTALANARGWKTPAEMLELFIPCVPTYFVAISHLTLTSELQTAIGGNTLYKVFRAYAYYFELKELDMTWMVRFRDDVIHPQKGAEADPLYQHVKGKKLRTVEAPSATTSISGGTPLSVLGKMSLQAYMKLKKEEYERKKENMRKGLIKPPPPPARQALKHVIPYDSFVFVDDQLVDAVKSEAYRLKEEAKQRKIKMAISISTTTNKNNNAEGSKLAGASSTIQTNAATTISAENGMTSAAEGVTLTTKAPSSSQPALPDNNDKAQPKGPTMTKKAAPPLDPIIESIDIVTLLKEIHDPDSPSRNDFLTYPPRVADEKASVVQQALDRGEWDTEAAVIKYRASLMVRLRPFWCAPEAAAEFTSDSSPYQNSCSKEGLNHFDEEEKQQKYQQQTAASNMATIVDDGGGFLSPLGKVTAVDTHHRHCGASSSSLMLPVTSRYGNLIEKLGPLVRSAGLWNDEAKIISKIPTNIFVGSFSSSSQPEVTHAGSTAGSGGVSGDSGVRVVQQHSPQHTAAALPSQRPLPIAIEELFADNAYTINTLPAAIHVNNSNSNNEFSSRRSVDSSTTTRPPSEGSFHQELFSVAPSFSPSLNQLVALPPAVLADHAAELIMPMRPTSLLTFFQLHGGNFWVDLGKARVRKFSGFVDLDDVQHVLVEALRDAMTKIAIDRREKEKKERENRNGGNNNEEQESPSPSSLSNSSGSGSDREFTLEELVAALPPSLRGMMVPSMVAATILNNESQRQEQSGHQHQHHHHQSGAQQSIQEKASQRAERLRQQRLGGGHNNAHSATEERAASGKLISNDPTVNINGANSQQQQHSQHDQHVLNNVRLVSVSRGVVTMYESLPSSEASTATPPTSSPTAGNTRADDAKSSSSTTPPTPLPPPPPPLSSAPRGVDPTAPSWGYSCAEMVSMAEGTELFSPSPPPPPPHVIDGPRLNNNNTNSNYINNSGVISNTNKQPNSYGGGGGDINDKIREGGNTAASAVRDSSSPLLSSEEKGKKRKISLRVAHSPVSVQLPIVAHVTRARILKFLNDHKKYFDVRIEVKKVYYHHEEQQNDENEGKRKTTNSNRDAHEEDLQSDENYDEHPQMRMSPADASAAQRKENQQRRSFYWAETVYVSRADIFKRQTNNATNIAAVGNLSSSSSSYGSAPISDAPTTSPSTTASSATASAVDQLAFAASSIAGGGKSKREVLSESRAAVAAAAAAAATTKGPSTNITRNTPSSPPSTTNCGNTNSNSKGAANNNNNNNNNKRNAGGSGWNVRAASTSSWSSMLSKKK